ncbi:DUF488 family protein [Fictibacillus gelatini]|uniref:DUF488 family protein, N3 subclade n=1 Tax=Fictibacillus gelatini TaxID=225985 RepID=UPI0004786B19|nr:DUF488 family protein [Fictibacillus gelatini]
MANLVPTGRLYTSNPSGLKYLKEQAELWQIMRAGPELPSAIRVKELSPSDQLFKRYIKEWRGKPPIKWWTLYEEQFMKEMKTEEKLQGLRAVYKGLLLGRTIVLICFCEDHRVCHRRLVGEFFKQYGVEAVELNPVNSDQLTLF